MRLPIPQETCQVMYVWIDATRVGMRGKSRTLDFVPQHYSDLPVWNFDGSSTGQSEGKNSDVFLHPIAMYPDPFRKGNNKLVLCDTSKLPSEIEKGSQRQSCYEALKRCSDQSLWFGIGQEFTLHSADSHLLNWPKNGYPGPQGPYYCGVGADKVHGRRISEGHYRACLYAGIKISGTNAEILPAGWEFQIGPCEGIQIADDLWMARYILYRVAELYNVIVSTDPKPIGGKWNGSGMHVNVSTQAMRKPGGITEINTAIEKLSKVHSKHLLFYDAKGGKDNERRLVGSYNAPKTDEFTAEVASRNSSIRIPRIVSDQECGYFEDRRPAANADPYMVTDVLAKTICLDESLRSTTRRPSVV